MLGLNSFSSSAISSDYQTSTSVFTVSATGGFTLSGVADASPSVKPTQPSTPCILYDNFSPIDPTNPVDWSHPLNIGRVGWWLCTNTPGWRGSNTLHDLVRGGRHNPNDGAFSATAPVWGGSHGHPGGIGSLTFYNGTITTPTLSAATSSGNFTIAAWLYNLPSIVVNNSANTIYWKSGVGGAIRFYNGTAYDASSPVPTNVWTRVVTSRIGNTLSHYYNGNLINSQTMSGVSLSFYLLSGSSTSFMDDLSFWQRGLSAQDIALDYSISRQGYPGVLKRISAIEYSFSPPTYILSSSGGITLSGVADAS